MAFTLSRMLKMDQMNHSQTLIKQLEAMGMSRKMIAHSLGVSATTLHGWMAPNAPRPIPKPVTILLEKILSEMHNHQSLRFTLEEIEIIQEAVKISGAKNFHEFAYSAIVVKARKLLTQFSDSQQSPGRNHANEELHD